MIGLDVGDDYLMNNNGIIVKSKKLHYILKALKHFGDEEYMDFFLERETNPLLLEFNKNGEEYFEKPFYIIHENGNGWGFFAEFRALLAKLVFADRFGMVPYIIWGSDFLYKEQCLLNGIDNAFEYYFKQPFGYSLNDVNNARLVTHSKSMQAVMIEREYKRDVYEISNEYLTVLACAYKKYIGFNKNIEQQIKEQIRSKFGREKVLGVHFRGTDFKVGYDNHPVAVQLEQTVHAIKEVIKDGKFTKIFVATDEEMAIESLKKEFGGIIIYYDDVFRGNSDKSIAFSNSDRQYHHYQLGYEVIRDMLTLSYSDGLVAGLSQVVVCARIAKASRGDDYEILKVINNGINHTNIFF
ncbi:hypothetical protein BEI61_01502 [Eisenbergiella tayi]|uniref:Uncharacterized protein n=2 Tax=Eisenbergiella tayi TaxID=1432052 RepID=A0A1E3AA32_9FIRM|nr:hypothetical protein BEI61_01502 [Eisenbergiella tayi]